MSVTKLSLIGLGLMVLGVGMYGWLRPEKEATVFEQKEGSEEEAGKTTSVPNTQVPPPASTTYVEILPKDCANECRAFQPSPDQYAYCQSVCGLSPDPATPAPKPSDPNLSQNLERKNEAIRASNLNKCGEMNDTDLRNASEVRVIEILL